MKPSEVNEILKNEVGHNIDLNQAFKMIDEKSKNQVRKVTDSVIETFSNLGKEKKIESGLKIGAGIIVIGLLSVPGTALASIGTAGYVFWKNKKEKELFKSFSISQSGLSDEEKQKLNDMSLSDYRKHAKVEVSKYTVKRFFEMVEAGDKFELKLSKLQAKELKDIRENKNKM